MVNIPPIKMVLTGRWCKWHCFTNIKCCLPVKKVADAPWVTAPATTLAFSSSGGSCPWAPAMFDAWGTP